MAKYWLMPNDMDKVAAFNAQLAEQIVLYSNYDVQELRCGYATDKCSL